jgi:HD-GYP domain-containing protein (c-di-GMP phosphodiesterase class II)
MFKHSIRTNILTIFLLLVGLVAIALLSSQYYFNQKIAADSTAKTFQLITKNISVHIKNNNNIIHNILLSNRDNSNIYQKITFDAHHQSFKDITQIMKLHQGITAIYFTQEDGSFYEIINMEESTFLFNRLKAPKETQWTVLININNQTLYSFLNVDAEIISSYSIKKNYAPKERLWYKEAIVSSQPIMTQPYKFSNLNESGITYALQLNNKGTVLAIDYTLEKLHTFLKLQKFEKESEIFLFNADGDKIISSNVIDSATYSIGKKPIHPILKEAFNHQTSSVITYNSNGKNYFSSYSEIGHEHLFLGITVDTKNLLQAYNDNLRSSLIISLLLLLFSLPMILVATNLIIKPIKSLINENEKIKLRKFKEVLKVKTNIIEFIELSDSFVVMSQSIDAYQKSQAELLDAIVKLIAEAVDAKSPYTGGHCERVPQIAQMLIHEASKSNESAFREFSLTSEDELREFEIAAWLHDYGKVTTPEYVVDKSTKLETIHNRIHEIRTRFEVLWRDAQIYYLQEKLNAEDETLALNRLNTTHKRLLKEFKFIADANIGGEFMSQEKQLYIKEIADQEWQRNFDDSLGLGEVEKMRYNKEKMKTLPATEKLLSDKKQHLIKRELFDYDSYTEHNFTESVPEYLYNYGEVYNLCIAKGTLSPEERYKINEHVILTIKMLEKIPFPANMTKIPEYAGTHHETLIGTGYPRGLTKEKLSVPSRIMALADVFEALTASDRPYKKAKTLSESVKILSFMVKDEHLDADIFKLFLKSDLHNVYAVKYLKEEQIDEVDIEQYL